MCVHACMHACKTLLKRHSNTNATLRDCMVFNINLFFQPLSTVSIIQQNSAKSVNKS